MSVASGVAVFGAARILFLAGVVPASALGAGVALASAVLWRRRAHRAGREPGGATSVLALGSAAVVGTAAHLRFVYGSLSTVLSAAAALTLAALVAWLVTSRRVA